MEFKHEPIMLKEVIEYLNIKEDGIYVDGTIGGAGHSIKIISNLSNKGLLVGIDRDKELILNNYDKEERKKAEFEFKNNINDIEKKYIYTEEKLVYTENELESIKQYKNEIEKIKKYSNMKASQFEILY